MNAFHRHGFAISVCEVEKNQEGLTVHLCTAKIKKEMKHARIGGGMRLAPRDEVRKKTKMDREKNRRRTKGGRYTGPKARRIGARSGFNRRQRRAALFCNRCGTQERERNVQAKRKSKRSNVVVTFARARCAVSQKKKKKTGKIAFLYSRS